MGYLYHFHPKIIHLRYQRNLRRHYNNILLLSLAPQPSLGLGLLHKIRLNFLEASQQFSFLQIRVNPTTNPRPGGPGLCIYIPQRQGYYWKSCQLLHQRISKVECVKKKLFSGSAWSFFIAVLSSDSAVSTAQPPLLQLYFPSRAVEWLESTSRPSVLAFRFHFR
jgi:hypothetical protein